MCGVNLLIAITSTLYAYLFSVKVLKLFGFSACNKKFSKCYVCLHHLFIMKADCLTQHAMPVTQLASRLAVQSMDCQLSSQHLF